jgi:hypothetical protein
LREFISSQSALQAILKEIPEGERNDTSKKLIYIKEECQRRINEGKSKIFCFISLINQLN